MSDKKQRKTAQPQKTQPQPAKPQPAKPLSLHVPEPAVRPGGKPDFSNVPIPEAGSVPRPPVDVDPRDIRDLAYLDHPRARTARARRSGHGPGC